MQLFILFVFGAVVLGAGAMLSPALPTRQPRMGLAAALSLALVVGGAVFYASLFGWDTLVIDYLLFALMSFVVLGGTLSHAQTRAEAKGEILADSEQGWPGPYDLVFFGVTALLFIVPLVILPVPLGTVAQEQGYLALTARLGETLNSLAPFYPEVNIAYPPGLIALTAYLSQQLNQPIPMIQMGVITVVTFLSIWLLYDLGAEVQDKRLGRAMALVALLSFGLFGLLLDAQFSALMGLFFGLAFVIFVLRYLRETHWFNALGAGLMLGATLIADFTVVGIIALAYALWLVALWLLPATRPTLKTWSVLALGIPLIASVATAPWWVNQYSLLSTQTAVATAQPAIGIGLLITLPLALLGAGMVFRRRNPFHQQVALFALGWLLVVVDVAVTRILPTLLPVLDRLMDTSQIFTIGLVIPLALLGGFGGLWLWDRFVSLAWRTQLRRWSYALMAGLALIILLTLVIHRPLIEATRSFINAPGALATEADRQAMLWLKENTPDDTRILNYPDEGIWATIIAERDSVYTPQLRFASDLNSDEQIAFRAFWEHPADTSNEALLKAAGIDYVLVPQVATAASDSAMLFRWEVPHRIETQSTLTEADYLELVFEQDGAQVYQVK